MSYKNVCINICMLACIMNSVLCMLSDSSEITPAWFMLNMIMSSFSCEKLINRQTSATHKQLQLDFLKKSCTMRKTPFVLVIIGFLFIFINPICSFFLFIIVLFFIIATIIVAFYLIKYVCFSLLLQLLWHFT